MSSLSLSSSGFTRCCHFLVVIQFIRFAHPRRRKRWTEEGTRMAIEREREREGKRSWVRREIFFWKGMRSVNLYVPLDSSPCFSSLFIPFFSFFFVSRISSSPSFQSTSFKKSDLLLFLFLCNLICVSDGKKREKKGSVNKICREKQTLLLFCFPFSNPTPSLSLSLSPSLSCFSSFQLPHFPWLLRFYRTQNENSIWNCSRFWILSFLKG